MISDRQRMLGVLDKSKQHTVPEKRFYLFIQDIDGTPVLIYPHHDIDFNYGRADFSCQDYISQKTDISYLCKGVTGEAGHTVEITFRLVFQGAGRLSNGNEALILMPDAINIICYPLGATIGVG